MDSRYERVTNFCLYIYVYMYIYIMSYTCVIECMPCIYGLMRAYHHVCVS